MRRIVDACAGGSPLPDGRGSDIPSEPRPLGSGKREVTALEAEVNERIYRLFGLSRDEIALIEETLSEPRP